MQIFRNRPLALAICIAAAVACVAAGASESSKLICVAVALAIGVLCCVLAIAKRRLSRFCLTAILTSAACACLLVGSWLWFGPISSRYLAKVGEVVRVEGYVTERRSDSGDQSRFAIRVTEFDGASVRASLLLECDYRSALQAGDRFCLFGTVREFEETESYDEERSLRSDGLVAVLTCAAHSDCTVTGERVDTPRLFFRRINRDFCERLRAAIGGEEGDLACALLLGDRTQLSDGTTLAFRRSGVSHLLALSGLHVSILIGILEWILHRLRVPKRLRVAAIPPIAIGYLLLTGGAVSTVRAVLMTSVLSVACLLAERYDPFTSLSVSLFCILAVTPYAVFDVSLWLSFCAAASIVIFLPAVRGVNAWRGWSGMPRLLAKGVRALLLALATGVFASNGILVLSAATFGSVSVFSVPLTLMLSPLVTAALFAGIGTLCVPFAAPLARVPLAAMLAVANAASRVEGALCLPTARLEWGLLFLSAALTVAIAVLPLRRTFWCALPPLLSAVALVFCSVGICAPHETAYTYLHTRLGEVLVVTSGGTCAVFDFSGGASYSVYETVEELENAGCAEVDELVLSHYHAQVTALLNELCKRVLVRRVRLPNPEDPNESAIAARIADEAERLGVALRYGTEELAVSNTEVSWAETFGGGGTEKSLGMTVCVGEERLTLLSGQLVGSEEWLSLYPRLLLTDTLVLLSHGQRDATEQAIRLPSSLTCVIWGDAETARLHPTVTAPKVSYLAPARVHRVVP